MNFKQINLDNYKKIQITDLRNSNFKQLFSDLLYEIDLAYVPDYARQVFLLITDLIAKAEDGEVLSKKYFNELVTLRLMSLSMVSDEEKAKFINENIVIIVKQDYADLQKWLNVSFNIFDYEPGVMAEIRRLFITALETSNNLIGNSEITVQNVKVKPFIKSWLIDYKIFPNLNPNRGVVEEVQYINISPNTKILSREDRDVLKKVLSFYDWLRYKLDKIKPITISNAFLKPSPTSNSVMHGQSIDFLKNELGVKRTLPVKPVAPQPVGPSKSEVMVKEIKREVDTLELPANNPIKPIVPKPVVKPKIPIPLKPVVLPKPDTGMKINPAANLGLNSINDIKVLDDLKKIDVRHLRAGDIAIQLNLIKSKILFISQVNRILPFYAVQTFEQSPLFKIYLSLGSLLISDRNADRKLAFEQASKSLASTGQGSLTLKEFEAVADLRKEIEKL